MIVLDLSILNQKGTPMFNSDLTANRPAAGIVGRIFIATDSPYGIFRDTGTAWDQVSSAGGGISGSLAVNQVAFGSATNTISGSNNFIWNNGLTLTITNPYTITQTRTGTTGLAQQMSNNGNTLYFGVQSSTAGLFLFSNGSLLYASFFGSSTNTATQFASNSVIRQTIFPSGNILLHDGGTPVDAGFKVDIQGTTRVTGILTLGSNINFTTTDFRINDVTFERLRFANGFSSMNNQNGQQFIMKSVAFGSPTIDFTNNQAGSTIADITTMRVYPTYSGNIGTTGRIHSVFELYATGSPGSGGTPGLRYLYINPATTGFAFTRAIETTIGDVLLCTTSGSVGIRTTSIYAPSTFSLDVNGGLLVKNTAGTTAQITLINADPSLGGNNGFLVASVGGTSGGSYVDFQGYYGTSIVGSTALRLNPAGGAVIVNSTTNTGEQFQLTGTLRINGQSSGTSGGNSGQHLIINLDGTTYKIKLELP